MALKRYSGGILGLKAAVHLSADKKAPTEITLLRHGMNDSDYGPILFDAQAADMVMGEFRRKGIPRLFADWNHGTIPTPGGPPPTREQAKSSCSFVPMVNAAGDLIASDIRWTEKGRADVESEEYGLFSPAFVPVCDGDTCRPGKLVNFALVNRAGLDGIAPILAAYAASLEKESNVEYEKLYNEEKARVVALTAELATARAASADVLALGAAIGMVSAPNADRVATLTSLVTLRTDVLKLAGKDNVAEALGVLEGNKSKAAGFDALKAESEQRDLLALSAKLDATIDRGIKELKIAPAVKDMWRDDALAYGGGKPTEAGITKLAAKIDASPAYGTPVGGGPVQKPNGAVSSDPRMDRLMNIDPVKFAEFQAKQAQQ